MATVHLTLQEIQITIVIHLVNDALKYLKKKTLFIFVNQGV